MANNMPNNGFNTQAQGYQQQPNQNFQPQVVNPFQMNGMYQPTMNNTMPVYQQANLRSTDLHGLPGKIINSYNEITPNDVPMNGSVGVFLQSDYSCIYAKAWTSDGTITTVKYVPEKSPQQESKPEPSNDDIMKQLDDIKKMLKSRNKYNNHRNVPEQSVKEVKSDE
jgi:hypothetical protein